MRKYFKYIALLLALVFALTACAQTAEEAADTSDTQAAEDTPTNNDDHQNGDKKEEDGSKEKDGRYGTALNVDGDIPTYMYMKYVGDEVDKENDAHFTDGFSAKIDAWYEDRYADCGLSDILFSISLHNNAEKYQRQFEQIDPDDANSKVAVDYTTGVNFRASYLIATETDGNLYKDLFRMCREDGVNPWLSFRMNDVHYANETTGHDAFFYTAKKNGWLIGDSRFNYWLNNKSTQGSRFWYAYAFNYAVPEVREYFLGKIEAQLEMYDPYGIELDWQRVIWCFPTDTLDNTQYMDAFMEDLNELVARYEERYGHEIKISARINRDIDENMYFGFDVRNWAKNGWIDVVIPSCYWGATDTAIPVAEWKTKLAEYPDVQIWPGVECHMMTNAYWQSIPTLAAQTAQYLSQGADKMYLYNLFNDIKEKFLVCASLENALAAAKRSYVINYSNTTPYGVDGIDEYIPLPISVTANERSDGVLIEHGTLDYTKDSVIYVAVVGVHSSDVTADTLSVYYNGIKCTYRGTSTKSYLGTSTTYGLVFEFVVPKADIDGSESGYVRFTSNTDLTVNYVELMNGNSRV